MCFSGSLGSFLGKLRRRSDGLERYFNRLDFPDGFPREVRRVLAPKVLRLSSAHRVYKWTSISHTVPTNYAMVISLQESVDFR